LLFIAPIPVYPAHTNLKIIKIKKYPPLDNSRKTSYIKGMTSEPSQRIKSVAVAAHKKRGMQFMTTNSRFARFVSSAEIQAGLALVPGAVQQLVNSRYKYFWLAGA
jgi:hypothetical protein